MNAWTIAVKNLRRHKGPAIALAVLTALGSALLAAAWSVLAEGSTPFDRWKSDHHEADVFISPADRAATADLLAELADDPQVADTVALPYLDLSGATVDGVDTPLFFVQLAPERDLSPTVVAAQDSTVPAEKAVYPASSLRSGYQVGDDFTFTFNGIEHTFTVAGFSQSLLDDSYLAPAAFRTLAGHAAEGQQVTVRLTDPDQAKTWTAAFNDAHEADGTSAAAYDQFAAQAATLNATLAGIVLALAVILFTATVIVVAFQVSHRVRQNLPLHGTLKALGYTSGRLRRAQVAEYLLVAAPAVLLVVPGGIALTGLIQILSAQLLGIAIPLRFHPAQAALTLAVLVGVVVVSVWVATRRLRRVTPVDAIRPGGTTRRPRVHWFPLDRGIGSVNQRLAAKSLLGHWRKAGLVTVVVAVQGLLVGVAAVFSANTVGDTTRLFAALGQESFDLLVVPASGADSDALAGELATVEGVRQVVAAGGLVGTVGTTARTPVKVYDDPARLEFLRPYEGRWPTAADEVALVKTAADSDDLRVGDSVHLTVAAVTQTYEVTGLYSSPLGGESATLAADGARRLDPAYTSSFANVYLEDGAQRAAVKRAVETRFGLVGEPVATAADPRWAAAQERAEQLIGDYLQIRGLDSVEYAVDYQGEIIMSGTSRAYRVAEVLSFDVIIDQTADAASAITTVLIALIGISAVVLALITYTVIDSVIAARRHDLGLFKAVGYTDARLRAQITTQLLPPAAVGTALGVMVAALGASELMGALVPGFRMAVPVVGLVATSLGFLAVIAATAWVTARRVARIQPYELITE
ncbi:MAG: FtsX-like permease family protein [Micrococcales bacterium]|nr:FtsX-like permease family protein [Micrococcales bacterium]